MTQRSEVLVGLVFVLGLALVVGGTIWMQGRGFGREERTVQARVREVGQLQDGNPVKLRGVPIGRVSDVRIEDAGAGVIIDMSVDNSVEFPEDPVAVLSPESFFGDWQVEIFPRSRFPSYSYAESPDPQVLPGYSLPDFGRLTAVADRIAENLAVITERVDIAFTEETALNIRQAVDNLQQVSAELTELVRTQERSVRELGEDLQTTTATVNRVASAIERTFSQFEQAVEGGEIGAIVENAYAVSEQLDSIAATLNSTSAGLNRAVAAADSTLNSLARVAGSVERGEGTLGMLMQDTALYEQLVLTNTVLQDLLLDFQKNPRKYVNLSIF